MEARPREPSRGTSRAKTFRFPPTVCWPELSTLSSASSFWQPRLAGRSIPERVDARDIALLGMATHKLSLIGSQDVISSPLRAPFTELREKESPKKVEEKPRGEGLRRIVGELLTCKFCLSVWVASLFTYGLVLAPRVTRLVAALFSVVTVSDYLHQAYKVLMKEASN